MSYIFGVYRESVKSIRRPSGGRATNIVTHFIPHRYKIYKERIIQVNLPKVNVRRTQRVKVNRGCTFYPLYYLLTSCTNR